MKKRLLILFVFISTYSSFAQTTRFCSGFVKDSTSNEVLIGANIIDPIQKVGTATNNYGFFSD
ncbi:MAG: hypothetical protein RBR68_04040 [Tenuifilaceae bacterium]|nr:hypothetical protein [Tenuifilaceae bacterium]